MRYYQDLYAGDLTAGSTGIKTKQILLIEHVHSVIPIKEQASQLNSMVKEVVHHPEVFVNLIFNKPCLTGVLFPCNTSDWGWASPSLHQNYSEVQA